MQSVRFDYPADKIPRFRQRDPLANQNGSYLIAPQPRPKTSYDFGVGDFSSKYNVATGLLEVRSHTFFQQSSYLTHSDPQPFLWRVEARSFGSRVSTVRCTCEVYYLDPTRNKVIKRYPFGAYQTDIPLTEEKIDDRRRMAQIQILQFHQQAEDLASKYAYDGPIASGYPKNAEFLPPILYQMEGRFLYPMHENLFIENWDLYAFDQAGPLKYGMGMALLDAVDSLPALAMNNIANIIEAIKVAKELIELIFDAVKGDVASVPKSGLEFLKELWLGYRYAWSTTRSDIYETAEYFDRLCGLLQKEAIQARGKYAEAIEGGTVIYRASFTCPAAAVIPPEIKSLQQLLHLDDYWMRTFGIALTPANVWDMVPFSFVVDWFLKIGDILEKLDTRSRAFEIPISKVWYSVRTQYDESSEQHYIRVVGPRYIGLPVWSHQLSNKGSVWAARLTDILAIFGGK
jgi:hypothetical protein